MRLYSRSFTIMLVFLFLVVLTGMPGGQTVSASPAIQLGPTQISSTATAVSGGANHSCAIDSGGGAICWGYNAIGQLGDGTRTQRNTAGSVNGLTSNVQAVVTGQNHSCALTSGGGVKCWGANFYGQLGDNSGTTQTTPVDVSGLTSGVTAIAAGGNHNCALVSGGGVKCWGFNPSGQLGNASNSNSPIPVNVSGLASGASGIAAGGGHSCARLAAGGAKCWGDNSGGQLGNGSTTESNIPVTVNTLVGVLTAIDLGEEHTCALTNTGGMYCWGKNNNGRVGDGSFSDKTAPVQVSGLASGVTGISAGGQFSCAVASGGVKCWGENGQGQLGDGTTNGHATPADVSGLTSGVASVNAGEQHACVVTASGGMKCWGFNLFGQLGDGTSGLYFSPVTVVGFSSGAASVDAGDSHTCALTNGGGLKCWGANNIGQLGNASNSSSNIPVDVNGLTSGAAGVSAGTSHTCAYTTGGGAKCWGYNQSGQLGNGSNSASNTPQNVSGLASGVSQVSAGGDHSCARTNTGGVKCWGLNSNGQLGTGNNSNSNVPIDVTGLPAPATQVTTGYAHTCVLTSAGAVLCWGLNSTGQLGNSGTGDSNTPVAVTGLSSGVIAVAAGWDHTCAVMNTGGVKCWGKNYSGQLGIGSTGGYQSAPTDVSGLSSGATSVSGGAAHTCAIVSGGLKCWGSNTDGQLGSGSADYSDTPVDVTGLSSGVLNASAGGGHTCAVVSPSTLKCWGSSDDGEVGTGIPIQRLTPVSVLGYDSLLRLYLPMIRKP